MNQKFSSKTWAVLLSKPEYLNWPLLGKAIASFKKIPMQDAAHQAKMSWGILEENLGEEEARNWGLHLDQSSLGGVAAPAEKLMETRPPNFVNHIDLVPDGLQIEAAPGQFRVIPWTFFCVTAVSVFKKSTVKTIKIQEGPSAAEKLTKAGILIATGIPLPMRKKKSIEKQIEDPELFFFFDLFLRKNGLRIRLDAQALDYSFLRERKDFGAHNNFRLLVHEVGKCAQHALFNRGMRVILNNQPINTAGYETESDLEKECRWLLSLAYLKE